MNKITMNSGAGPEMKMQLVLCELSKTKEKNQLLVKKLGEIERKLQSGRNNSMARPVTLIDKLDKFQRDQLKFQEFITKLEKVCMLETKDGQEDSLLSVNRLENIIAYVSKLAENNIKDENEPKRIRKLAVRSAPFPVTQDSTISQSGSQLGFSSFPQQSTSAKVTAYRQNICDFTIDDLIGSSSSRKKILREDSLANVKQRISTIPCEKSINSMKYRCGRCAQAFIEFDVLNTHLKRVHGIQEDSFKDSMDLRLGEGFIAKILQ